MSTLTTTPTAMERLQTLLPGDMHYLLPHIQPLKGTGSYRDYEQLKGFLHAYEGCQPGALSIEERTEIIKLFAEIVGV